MKRSIRNTMVLCGLLFPFLVVGQQDPNFTFYRYNMNLVNPAFAGSGGTEIGLSVRSQWAGIEGSPETQGLFASHGFGNKVGLGVSAISDRTFVERQTSLSIDFSYRLGTGEATALYLGLKAGLNSYGANLAGLETHGAATDPLLAGLDGGFSPNVGVGALWKGARYYLAVSAPKLLSNGRLSVDGGTVSVNRGEVHLYFSGGYDIVLGSGLVFGPSVLVRHINASPLSVDLTGIFDIGRRFELGGAYRIGEGLGGLFVFKVDTEFRIGYAHEIADHGPVRDIANGTHEVFIRVGI